MNIIDSSAWLEYFADGPDAELFAEQIQASEELLVPTITLYEVFKKVLRERNQTSALQAVAAMQMGNVVDLDAATALHAAKLSLDHRLPMADSIILATARAHKAVLWTQDSDFEGIEGVQYREKKK